MKKVGIVTNYYNYGSILQAYALKTFFEQNGCICEMLTHKKPSFLFRDTAPKWLIKLNIVPHFFVRNAKIGTPYNFNSRFIINKNNFMKERLHPTLYDMKLLKELAHSNTFDHFFAGSDQIWHSADNIPLPYFLLDFAPNNKKNAIAPSLGCPEIKDEFVPTLKNSFKTFNALSTREKLSSEVLKQKCDVDAPVLSDPVTLFDRQFWSDFSKDGRTIPNKYIFAHYLGHVPRKHLKLIQELANAKHLKIVSFFNDANKYVLRKNVINIKGTPEDFISLLKNAEYVATDSFHTCQFSIIFNKKFFLSSRNYTKGGNEQVRFIELKRKFDCPNSFIPENATLETLLNVPECNYDEKLKYWSNLTKNYILKILNDTKTKVNNITVNQNICTNCKLCQQVCPKGAISFKPNNFLYTIPSVDTSKCVNCGICLKKCNELVKHNNTQHKGYIAYNKNKELRKKSASGGIFSALASEFIKKGGVVFGAKLILDGSNSRVELAKATTTDELLPLLNSKYVECECYHAFSEIKDLLDKGTKVLVSNTSCKIDALYKYLGKEYENLYTIDLICHGTPGNPLFAKYIEYLEDKHSGKVTKFAFRRKSIFSSYCETTEITSQNKQQILYTKAPKSTYFSLFLKEQTYRECCYNCKYSSINKPADITIGDYHEAKRDYPFLVTRRMIKKGLSSLITHNSHGEELLNEYGISINKVLVDYKRIQLSHKQLCSPASYSQKRFSFFSKTKLFE